MNSQSQYEAKNTKIKQFEWKGQNNLKIPYQKITRNLKIIIWKWSPHNKGFKGEIHFKKENHMKNRNWTTELVRLSQIFNIYA